MVQVKKKAGQSNDALISQFNREVQAEGIIFELKKREHADKPSERKRRVKKLKSQMFRYAR